VARYETVKIVGRIEVSAIVVPTAEIGAGRGHSPPLPERLEKAVLVQIHENFVVVFKLFTEQAL
jgi:hypothetical protein